MVVVVVIIMLIPSTLNQGKVPRLNLRQGVQLRLSIGTV